MNRLLDEDVLQQLLADAAGTYPVPEPSVEVEELETSPWHRRRSVRAGGAVAALAAGVLALSAVGGGSTAQNDTAALKSAPGSSDSAGAAGGGTGSGLSPVRTSSTVAAPALPGTADSAGAVQYGTAEDGDESRVVKTGEVSLLVDEGKVGATVRRVQSIVAGLRGWVASSESQEAADHPSATLTVRVPVSSFETLTDRVRGLPVTVLSSSSSGKDVTASYADTQAQIASLRAARSRYLAILANAKTINETLTVQQRVDDVQQQIDRLEGQRRVLADTSDFGTLTVSVAEDRDEVLVEADSAWSRAWHDAVHGFTSGVQSIVAGSGRALLVALVLVVLAGVGRLGWRVARRRVL